MRVYPLSQKCEDALFESDYKYNFFIGAVRAGKTFTSCLRWIRFITTEVGDSQLCAIVGKSISTVEKNLISLLTEMAGPENVQYSRSKNELYIYGKKHMVVGATDEKAKDKIQGLTLMGALCDEICLYPKSFVDMLKTRLSEAGSKAFFTANPEGPYHHMKVDFIDKQAEINTEYGGKGLGVWCFTMEDNLSLDEEFKSMLRASLKGMYYERLVLGKWVNAAGLVYDMFVDKEVKDLNPDSDTFGRVLNPSHVVNCDKILASQGRRRFKHYMVAADYGTTNPCAFVMIGYDDYWSPKYIVKEYFWDSKKEMRQKTDGEYANDMVQFMNGYNVTGVYLDPSAASFKAELLKKGVYTTNANNDVLDGIRFVSTLFACYDLFIDESCKNVRREYASNMWDEKSQLLGVDKPQQADDHSLDAIRYGLYTMFGLLSGGVQAGGNRR